MPGTPPLTGAIMLPDGTPVRGRGRRQDLPDGPLPDFGLNLGRLKRHEQSPTWPTDWLDWPDFRLPRDARAAAAAIRAAYERAHAGERVEVACAGGNGRTGTVVACMAILAGHPADDAVAWTRAHYRPHAVETPWQKRWVRRFPELLGRIPRS